LCRFVSFLVFFFFSSRLYFTFCFLFFVSLFLCFSLLCVSCVCHLFILAPFGNWRAVRRTLKKRLRLRMGLSGPLAPPPLCLLAFFACSDIPPPPLDWAPRTNAVCTKISLSPWLHHAPYTKTRSQGRSCRTIKSKPLVKSQCPHTSRTAACVLSLSCIPLSKTSAHKQAPPRVSAFLLHSLVHI